jgi:hypothetical protein
MPRRDDDFDDDDRPRRRAQDDDERSPRSRRRSDDDDDRPRRSRRDDDDDDDRPPPRRKKSNLALILGIVFGVLFLLCAGGGVAIYYAVKSAGGAIERVTSHNDMQQIGLGVMSYEGAKGDLPTNSYSPDGKPLLSWRVHILPYLGENALYQQFKLDEPWDSPTNRRLLDQMPVIFAAPGDRRGAMATTNKTYYRGFSSPGAIFERRKPGQKMGPMNITDGMSRTILFVEAATPVEWTKPDDLDASPAKPFPGLGGVRPKDDMILVAFADGSIRQIRRSAAEMNWRAAVTYAGGELLDLN